MLLSTSLFENSFFILNYLNSAHILLLSVSSIYFVAVLCLLPKFNKVVQNCFFVFIAISISASIAYRYLVFYKGSLLLLAEQMLQVCNFNFIAMPLMLLPKKIFKNYGFFIQSLCAATVFISASNSFDGRYVYEEIVTNFWYYHLNSFALPYFMIAAGRFKPERKYILPCLGLFLGYMATVAGVSLLLHKYSPRHIAEIPKYSFIFDTYGVPLFQALYNWIKLPFFYLLPLLPVYYLVCLMMTYIYDLVAKLKAKIRLKKHPVAPDPAAAP